MFNGDAAKHVCAMYTHILWEKPAVIENFRFGFDLTLDKTMLCITERITFTAPFNSWVGLCLVPRN